MPERRQLQPRRSGGGHPAYHCRKRRRGRRARTRRRHGNRHRGACSQRPCPAWSSRALWSHVTANENDPLHQGRIQVEFEWEHLDPQASHERAWLHTLTPYGGGSGGTGVGGRQSGQYSGFFSLPEIGERVLIEFLGDWDSEAVVIGGIRQYPQGETYNPHQTKRWSTPSGNEVLMHTIGAADVVQMKTQGKMVFESHLENGTHSLTLQSGGNPGDILHFQGDGASCRLDVSVATDLCMQAGSHIEIQGQSVTMRATGPGGIRLESAADGIGIESLTKGVTVQGQTGISLKAPGDKVALEGGRASLFIPAKARCRSAAARTWKSTSTRSRRSPPCPQRRPGNHGRHQEPQSKEQSA